METKADETNTTEKYSEEIISADTQSERKTSVKTTLKVVEKIFESIVNDSVSNTQEIVEVATFEKSKDSSTEFKDNLDMSENMDEINVYAEESKEAAETTIESENSKEITEVVNTFAENNDHITEKIEDSDMEITKVNGRN